jgi:hypothetical protein
MSLKDLYTRARLLWLALQEEYDLERKQEFEKLYKTVIKDISDIIECAPF